MQISSSSSHLFYAPAQRPEAASPRSDQTEEEKQVAAQQKQVEAQEKQAIEQEVQRLQQRDLEVRTHEQAHLAAAGGLAVSGPHYEMTKGPDGKQYVTDGHVTIDSSPAGNPEATVDKARRIRAAALAPARPSAADLSVAAKASQMEAQAQAEVRAEEQDEAQDKDAAEDALSGFGPDVAAADGLVAQAVAQGESTTKPRTDASPPAADAHKADEASTAEKNIPEAVAPPSDTAHSMEGAHLAQCPECQRKAYGLKAGDAEMNTTLLGHA